MKTQGPLSRCSSRKDSLSAAPRVVIWCYFPARPWLNGPAIISLDLSRDRDIGQRGFSPDTDVLDRRRTAELPLRSEGVGNLIRCNHPEAWVGPSERSNLAVRLARR